MSIWFNQPFDYYDLIFNMMDYRKIVIKKHIDIPECEQKGRCIVLMEKTKNNKEYKNYPYFMATNPYSPAMGDCSDPFGYCIGYNVTTIPYGNGCTEKFMPIYLRKSGEKRIRMNLEFKEEYEKYKFIFVLSSIGSSTSKFAILVAKFSCVKRDLGNKGTKFDLEFGPSKFQLFPVLQISKL